MTGTPRGRVRVTGPPRGHVRAPRSVDIDTDTRLGGIYMGSLLREQLRLALRVLAALALTVGLLPLAFHLVPRLRDLHVLGLPLAWFLLGVAVYPWLLLLGWLYVRRAERNETDFVDLVSGR